MRKEIEIKIEEGRDAGKVFKVEEMPAVQMDRWMTKAFRLLSKNGEDVSTLTQTSISGLLMKIICCEEAGSEELLNELLACCSFKKDGVDIIMKGALIDSVIEDWSTLLQLKTEALKLNLGFLEDGGDLKSE